MLRALTVGIGAGALLAGCYRSHERIAAPDGGDDVRAPAVCRVECDAVERLASFDASRLPEIEALDAVAADGNRLVVLGHVRRADGAGRNYVLVGVDLTSGEVTGPVEASGLGTWEEPVEGALSRAPGGWSATLLTSRRFDTTARLNVASFSDDIVLRAEAADVAPLPFPHAPGTTLPASAAARQGRAVLAAVDGETLWISRLSLAPSPADAGSIALARFPGAPPRGTPTSVALRDDGRVAVAGGGYARGLEPRDGFLALERVDGAAAIVDIPGERFDPPPMVLAAPSGATVFRHVSDPLDLDESGIRAELRDEDGVVTDATHVRTAAGLVPLGMATFEGVRSGGLVWVEPDLGLRVLAEGGSGSAARWDECTAIDVGPMYTLPLPLRLEAAIHYDGAALLAVSAPGPAGEVIVVALTYDDSDRVFPLDIEVLRVPECRLNRLP